MASNDILKMDMITDLNIHKCLLFLACEIVENKAVIAAQNEANGNQTTQL